MLDFEIRRQLCKFINDNYDGEMHDYDLESLGYDEKTWTNALKQLLEEGSVVGYKHIPTLTETQTFFLIGIVKVTDIGKERYNLL